MELRLQERSYLVIGATGGIGQAVCHALVHGGAGKLGLGVRRPDAGVELAQRLAAENTTQVSVIPCDLAAPGQPDRCIAEAQATLGALDGLVLCAGDPPWGGLWDVTDDDWQRLLSTMLMGQIRAVRAALPTMVERGRGRVVIVAGLNGRKPAPGGIIAGVVCAGLANFATAVAKDVAASGVTVNVVDPHLTDTPRWQRQLDHVQRRQAGSRDDAAASLLKDVPRKRPIPAEDVAEVVTFLLSDRAGSVTGAAIPVDGGVAPTIY